jgi:hypothetical protein
MLCAPLVCHHWVYIDGSVYIELVLISSRGEFLHQENLSCCVELLSDRRRLLITCVGSYHEAFLRGRPDLIPLIKRPEKNGTRVLQEQFQT